jgi:hypothetical protein
VEVEPFGCDDQFASSLLLSLDQPVSEFKPTSKSGPGRDECRCGVPTCKAGKDACGSGGENRDE